jgi:hypothetical protein
MEHLSSDLRHTHEAPRCGGRGACDALGKRRHPERYTARNLRRWDSARKLSNRSATA